MSAPHQSAAGRENAWSPSRWPSHRRRIAERQFGACCPTCPDGGRTVLYRLTDHGQEHRCISAAHVGGRQHQHERQPA